MLLFVIRGYKRGFFKSAVSAIGIVLAVFLTGILNPFVNTLLYDYTSLDGWIKTQVETKLQLEENLDEMTRNQEVEFIDNLKLPDTIKKQLLENSNSDTYVELGVKNFSDFITEYIAGIVIKGIAYVVTYIVVLLIIVILIAVANIANYIPIVKSINKAGGIVFGLCQGMLIVWVIMGLITMFSVFEWASLLMKMIDESWILSNIYKNDIFLKIMVDIADII
jgi:uncharacterized membrane protein required for colicin V production